MSQLQRLLFLQGQRCFFCDQTIPQGQASIEHLAAVSNGGNNADTNCVVCCQTLNFILGNLSVKDKIRVILSHRGTFVCPRSGAAQTATQPAPVPKETGTEAKRTAPPASTPKQAPPGAPKPPANKATEPPKPPVKKIVEPPKPPVKKIVEAPKPPPINIPQETMNKLVDSLVAYPGIRPRSLKTLRKMINREFPATRLEVANALIEKLKELGHIQVEKQVIRYPEWDKLDTERDIPF